MCCPYQWKSVVTATTRKNSNNRSSSGGDGISSGVSKGKKKCKNTSDMTTISITTNDDNNNDDGRDDDNVDGRDDDNARLDCLYWLVSFAISLEYDETVGEGRINTFTTADITTTTTKNTSDVDNHNVDGTIMDIAGVNDYDDDGDNEDGRGMEVDDSIDDEIEQKIEGIG